MKTIIVPTDFSANADNALTYACELAKKTGAGILLLHSYHVPIPTSDYPVVPLADDEIKNVALEGLANTKSSFMKKYPEITFQTEATLGLAADEIKTYAQKTGCEMVVMGTHGASGLKEFIIGSNTASVIDKVTCPVLTIPENATFRGLQKIVFAADYGNHNFSHMHKLIDLARLFDSEIILVHVSSGNLEETFEDIEIGRFKERIAIESNYHNITYRFIEDEDVYKGLNDYISQNNPDVFAISMRHRNLIQKLFSRSLTKRMAYHSHVPVLALHIAN